MLFAVGLDKLFDRGRKEALGLSSAAQKRRRQQAKSIRISNAVYTAEVVDYQTLIKCGSLTPPKGKVRSEGKDYEMRDNDVVLFRINV